MKYITLLICLSLPFLALGQIDTIIPNPVSGSDSLNTDTLSIDTGAISKPKPKSKREFFGEDTYYLSYEDTDLTFRELVIKYKHFRDSGVFKVNFPRAKFPGISVGLWREIQVSDSIKNIR